MKLFFAGLIAACCGLTATGSARADEDGDFHPAQRRHLRAEVRHGA